MVIGLALAQEMVRAAKQIVATTAMAQRICRSVSSGSCRAGDNANKATELRRINCVTDPAASLSAGVPSIGAVQPVYAAP
jgi:hypothetical protein